MTGPYDDIINLPHHVSKTRPHMSMLERASQFSPFHALSGYSAAIQKTARLTDEKIELREDDLSVLNEKLRLLEDHLEESPEVSFVCFCSDERKDGGKYVVITGKVRRIGAVEGEIIFRGGEKIRLDRVCDIQSPFLSYER